MSQALKKRFPFTLWQLQVFCDIVRLGGYSAAARQLEITQPAASGLVTQLERIVGRALMERAGQAIAQAIFERFSRPAKKGVLVVAGKGNNGGDGFVVARLLKKKRIPCEVALLARRNELSPDAAHNLNAFKKLKGQVSEIGVDDVGLLGERARKTGLVVDVERHLRLFPT